MKALRASGEAAVVPIFVNGLSTGFLLQLAVYGIVRLFDRSKTKQAAEARPKTGSGVR